MTLDEGIKRFQHDVQETIHEVEERLRDARDHMIVSVERYSIAIALVLMAITTAVLIIGTLVVWWRHERRESHGEPVVVGEPRGDMLVKEPMVDKTVKEDTDAINNNFGYIRNGVARKRSPADNASAKGNSPVQSRLPVRTKVKAS